MINDQITLTGAPSYSARPSFGKVRNAATTWLASENEFFSALVEERVTNLKVLHMAHVCTAAFALLVLAAGGAVMAAAGVAWLCASLMAASNQFGKGGTK